MEQQDKLDVKRNQDDSLELSRAKGKRLRRVRSLANLSREEFCSDGDINIATLISWEIGRFGGLSAKGAQRVIARIAKEGVFCTPEWLLYEIGVGPEVRADFKKMSSSSEISENHATSKDTVIEELILFRKLNKNTIDFKIEDDSMLPHYHVGDYVAGIKYFNTKISHFLGWDCILQTVDGRILVRKLQLGPRVKSFNLISSNLEAKVKDNIIYDVELIAAAPILWHRRKNPRI